MQVYLDLPRSPYRFDLLLEFIKRRAYPARMVVERDTLWTFVGGHKCAFRQSGSAIVMTGPALAADATARLRQLARYILGLDRDLGDFYAAARRDERLWAIVAPVFGMPLFCAETVFEALVTLIIEQHITWTGALRAQQRLLRILHCGASAGGRKIYDFPTPEQLSALDGARLKPLKITNGRIKLLLDIARDAQARALDLERLRQLSPAAGYRRLLSIKGVGHWTAANALGRALGEYAYLSHNDVALQAAVNLYFYRGSGVKGAAQVLDTLGKYGEYAGLAGHFILLRWVLDKYPVLP